MTEQTLAVRYRRGHRRGQAAYRGPLGLVPDARHRPAAGRRGSDRCSRWCRRSRQRSRSAGFFWSAASLLVIHAFSIKAWRGFLWSLLLGVLYLVAGGWLAFFPFTGIITLTILLAALFIAEGVLEVVMALQRAAARGLGLAAAQRHHRRRRGRADRRRVAELGDLGDRAARRHQSDLHRRELHRAGVGRAARGDCGNGVTRDE